MSKSKRIIIAVGGSGQTVVSHFLRYATMAGVPGEKLPDIYILDADLKELIRDNVAKPSLYGEIEKLHSRLVEGLSASRRPPLHLLYPYRSDSALGNKQTFTEYLIGNRPGQDDQHKQRVLDGLFGKLEQELLIAEGFFARPNVGATAIFDKLHNGEDDRSLKLLKQAMESSDSPRVAVVGSTFGGTGSGGAPVIAQKLREWASDRNKVKIGVFLTLPWFSPGDLGKTFAENEDTLGKWETQWKNTAAGLRFYGTSRVFLNDLDVFITDFNGEKHPRKDDSNTGQPEYPHSFNIILAAQIQNYLTRPIPVNEEPGQYSLYFVAPQDDRRTMLLDGHDSPLFRFNAPFADSEDQYLRQDLSDWANQTQTLRLTLNKIADYIRQDFRLSDGSKRKRPDKFINLANALADTCTNMPGAIIEKGVGPFRSRDAGPKIYGGLATNLADRAVQLGAVIAWLQDAWEQSKKMPKLSPACMARDPLAIWDSYPALNGERNAEVGAIKLFDDAFEQASNIVQDFQQSIDMRREGGQQEPFHAAAALIEKILRDAIIKRGGPGRNGRIDENQPVLGHNEIASALVPLQIQSNLRNHYSLQLNLTRVLDHGNNRQGDPVSVFNESHPATLAGVTHYNVPSPWAAAHLNAWIQTAGFDGNNPQPVWTRAKLQLEAVLWGIFTKRLTVYSVPFKDLSRLGKILSGALKAELFGYNVTAEWVNIVYATVADADGKERTVAINHPACGWFSAPGLTEEEANWWSALGMVLPSQQTPNSDGSLEGGQLKAFLNFLQQLIDKSHSEDSPEQAGWYRVVGALVDELRRLVPESTRPSATEPLGSGFYLIDQHNESVFQVPLVYLSSSIRELIAEYCVAEVAVVTLGAGHRPADTPLKSQYLGKSGITAQFLCMATDGQGRTAVRYSLALGEHGTFEWVFTARVIDSFYTHTEIWPNFKLPDWKLYFLASVSADPREVRNYGFSVLDQNGDRIGAANRSFTHNHEIHGVPEFLVMEIPKDNRELGAFLFGLTTSQAGTKIFNMAVDFGTSHSCVYVTATNGERIPLDLSKPAEALGKPVFNNPTVKADDLIKTAFFLPSYSSSPQTADPSVLPTEFRLIGDPTPKPSDLSGGVKSFVIIPMRFAEGTLEEHIRKTFTLGSFKWPGALSGTDFEREEDGLIKAYLRQMLCMAAALLRHGGYSRLNMFRATYPEAFLLSRRRTYTKVVADTLKTVLGETGLAYEGDGALDAEALQEIASSQISEQRRSSLKKDTSGMVSESMAALLSASSSDYNLFAERGICIVLDMGGGTTDVAAYYSSGSGKRDQNQSIDSITDSIRYAGHDLLRLLAKPKIINDVLKWHWEEAKEGQQQAEENRCLRALKILVRDPDHFQKLKDNFNSPQYLPDVKLRMLLFFDGLFEYTRLLTLAYQKYLQADGQTGVVNIALFGNAWKLAELVYPSREHDFDCVIETFIDYLKVALGAGQDIQIRYEGLHDASIKEATAVGALKLNALDRQFSTPKAHASLAGLEVICHGSDGQETVKPADEFLEGFDRKGYDRSQPLTVKSLDSLSEWPFREVLRERYAKRDDAFITKQVAAAINQAVREPWIVPGDREPMKFSPMRLFLEHVWKETLSVAPLNEIDR